MFQSALRMRGLFNVAVAGNMIQFVTMFQSALRMRGLFNHESSHGVAVAPAFQSALRMRGLFNTTMQAMIISRDSFNPPCGCVAFSTRDTCVAVARGASVSIRLADAWPFQLGGGGRRRPPPTAGFNPPCGCVAFSTTAMILIDFWWLLFQSALRMRGLFNQVARFVLDLWQESFNPPCGCVAFSTPLDRPACVHEPPEFQSALRMRGLFNAVARLDLHDSSCVSIRLADAWPFQRRQPPGRGFDLQSFNPPCGCVAFSTCSSGSRTSW